MKIGVISDTRGLLRPKAAQELAGIAHIIHAGDIGRPEVTVGLRRIAPVIAIKGNVDTAPWAARRSSSAGGPSTSCMMSTSSSSIPHPAESTWSSPATRIGRGSRCSISVRGPRRFNLPVTVATLEMTRGGVRAVIHDLGRSVAVK